MSVQPGYTPPLYVNGAYTSYSIGSAYGPHFIVLDSATLGVLATASYYTGPTGNNGNAVAMENWLSGKRDEYRGNYLLMAVRYDAQMYLEANGQATIEKYTGTSSTVCSVCSFSTISFWPYYGNTATLLAQESGVSGTVSQAEYIIDNCSPPAPPSTPPSTPPPPPLSRLTEEYGCFYETVLKCVGGRYGGSQLPNLLMNTTHASVMDITPPIYHIVGRTNSGDQEYLCVNNASGIWCIGKGVKGVLGVGNNDNSNVFVKVDPRIFWVRIECGKSAASWLRHRCFFEKST